MKKLKDAFELYDVKVHAFILMTNHVHLLVTPKYKQGVSKMMQVLGRNYVKYINLMYQRTGTLWEGRFKSSLVASDDYFLNVSRYIELNPVRAGMVKLPGEYPWSSYRHNAMCLKIQLISEHILYQNLGQTRALRLSSYRSLFADGINCHLLEEIRVNLNKEWALVDSKFSAQIEKALGQKIKRCSWGGDRKSKKFKISTSLTP